MKTAIQQIIEQLEQLKIESTLPTAKTKRGGDYRIGLSKAIDICIGAKEIEEEQIKKAFDRLPLVCGDTCDTSEEYYLIYKNI